MSEDKPSGLQSNKKTRMGRPTKLTPEVQDGICATMRAGGYLSIAARREGVATRTLESWLARGKAEIDRVAANPRSKIRNREQPYVNFLRAVRKAEADAETLAVGSIMVAAKAGNAKAAAWYLEHKFPERWGRKNKIEVTGADGGPIKHGLTDEMADAFKRKIFGMDGDA